jgi:mannose-1-phosphate guanylyltransferase/mannose-6-phosphate isomerase
MVPVIMCGGAGIRLRPVSRESMPKHFVPMIDDRLSFQQVLERVAAPDLFEWRIVIASNDFHFIVAERVRELRIAADIVRTNARRLS